MQYAAAAHAARRTRTADHQPKNRRALAQEVTDSARLPLPEVGDLQM